MIRRAIEDYRDRFPDLARQFDEWQSHAKE